MQSHWFLADPLGEVKGPSGPPKCSGVILPRIEEQLRELCPSEREFAARRLDRFEDIDAACATSRARSPSPPCHMYVDSERRASPDRSLSLSRSQIATADDCADRAAAIRSDTEHSYAYRSSSRACSRSSRVPCSASTIAR
jgi:hypothetical protein